MDSDDTTRWRESDDSRAPTEKVCEHCGAAIDTGDWYPVTNERGEDGSVELYDFCSAACQDAWLRARSE